MKKKFFIILFLFIVGFSFLKITTNYPIFAQQDTPIQYFIEKNMVKDNEIVSEVITNNETTKKELEENGYILNKEENIYQKTINQEDANNTKIDLGGYDNTTNLENHFNEILKLQNEIFNKISEMFNGFRVYGLQKHEINNKQDINKEIINTQKDSVDEELNNNIRNIENEAKEEDVKNESSSVEDSVENIEKIDTDLKTQKDFQQNTSPNIHH